MTRTRMEAPVLTSVPTLLATAILRARARTLGIETNLWPEKAQFDLTSSASRAFMSPPDHGERRRSADAEDDALTGTGAVCRA